MRLAIVLGLALVLLFLFGPIAAFFTICSSARLHRIGVRRSISAVSRACRPERGGRRFSLLPARG